MSNAGSADEKAERMRGELPDSGNGEGKHFALEGVDLQYFDSDRPGDISPRAQLVLVAKSTKQETSCWNNCVSVSGVIGDTEFFYNGGGIMGGGGAGYGFIGVAWRCWPNIGLSTGKHALRDDTPQFIRVSVVADDLGDNHECGDEEGSGRKSRVRWGNALLGAAARQVSHR
ncbi:hypothetical protein B0H14DRAFT_2597343 [Mycena olivaceomarginata]|nr:hypothetical protein B0H14DRAFT_2597343 [Mycena olivaceomarginata]